MSLCLSSQYHSKRLPVNNMRIHAISLILFALPTWHLMQNNAAIGLVTAIQLFLPVQNKATSVFHYEMIGAAHMGEQKFVMESKFKLHVRKSLDNSKLFLKIEEPSGRLGPEVWSNDILRPLQHPFNVTVGTKGKPRTILLDKKVETNYTRARKELILKQLQEIFLEHKKYSTKTRRPFVKTEKLNDMPFGTCSTKVNASESAVYFTIDYEARRSDCEGKIDPFFTMDMTNVDVYSGSEFIKTFGFTRNEFDFQFVRLDARTKLLTEHTYDVEIYTYLNLQEIISDPEEEDTTDINMTTLGGDEDLITTTMTSRRRG